MPVSLRVWIREQNAAIADDPSWLGSEEHLEFLEKTVHEMPGLVDVGVAWVAPGQPGYWEAATRTIAAERPVPMPGATSEDIAKVVLLGIVHEGLHARYSSPATMYRRQLRQQDPRLRPAIERLFNFLEDGRITALGKTAEPGMAEELDEFLSTAIDQARSLDRANAETLTPNRPAEQLFFAVLAYSLTSEVPSPLRPDVRTALARLLPRIDSTREGETDDCGRAAFEIVTEVVNFKPGT